jgi:hypothetical protein
MRTTGFMVFAPVFLSEVGEDLLSAVTFAPAYSARFRLKDETLLGARSRDAHSGHGRQQGAHRNATRAQLDRRPSTAITPASQFPHGASTLAPINDRPLEKTLRKSAQASVMR